MKATELRIGNHINQGSYGNGKVTAYQIYQMQLKEDGGYVSEYYKKLKPIPLTEEWLVKFGFTIKGFKNGYQICTSSLGGWILDNGLSSIGIEFEYVHSLQNLYFALTGEELKLIK